MTEALSAAVAIPTTTRRLIRPPDPAIRGTALMYGRYGSAEACRRLLHLAFRDAYSALDLTYAAGRFWRDPLPPGLNIFSNNFDPEASTDLHVDFTATGLPSGAFDVVVYDPPHVADGGENGIMTRRYGTIRTTAALRELITDGAREAWRLSSVGILVKVTEHHHGGRFQDETRWVLDAVPAELYTKLSGFRARPLQAGRWRAERVPRSNGAVYLAFRHDGRPHIDFDELWRRQNPLQIVGSGGPRFCANCNAEMLAARPNRATCSSACRQRAYRRRLRA